MVSQDTRSNAIPEVLLDTADCKGKVRVIAGQCRDKRAVIDTRTPMMYLDIQLAKTGSIFETVREIRCVSRDSIYPRRLEHTT